MRARKTTALIDGLVISYEHVSDLHPHPRNARIHPKRQMDRLTKVINDVGFISPISIDENKTIIAGHARLAAAKLLGMTRVPTVILSHMNDAQKRMFMIAENKLCEMAGWNEPGLREEFEYFINLDLDIELTGFDVGEIDVLLHPPREIDQETLDDTFTEASNCPVVTQPGYLWGLEEHRVYCGDSLKPESFQAVFLEGELADMVFIDAPYNVPIDGHACGKGRIKHEEFAMAVGEKTPAEFEAFLGNSFQLLSERLTKTALIYSCMDWRHIGEMLAAGREAGLKLLNLIVWNKQNAGMGSFYRSQHELIFLWANGSTHRNNVKLGMHGRNRSNVWGYAGASSIGKGRSERLSWHPTLKPCSMVADAILDCTKPNDIVVDSFSGAGTTLIACEHTKRRARAIELEPRYVDITVRRWQKLTGKTAMCLTNGKSFSELEKIAEEQHNV